MAGAEGAVAEAAEVARLAVGAPVAPVDLVAPVVQVEEEVLVEAALPPTGEDLVLHPHLAAEGMIIIQVAADTVLVTMRLRRSIQTDIHQLIHQRITERLTARIDTMPVEHAQPTPRAQDPR